MDCHLCDKPLLDTDNKIVGMRTGTTIHMDCYDTWLREKMRGEEV